MLNSKYENNFNFRIVISGYTVSAGYNQSNPNILGILVLCIFLGSQIGKMKEKPQDIDELNEKKNIIAAGELLYDVLIAFSKPFISAIRFIIFVSIIFC